MISPNHYRISQLHDKIKELDVSHCNAEQKNQNQLHYQMESKYNALEQKLTQVFLKQQKSIKQIQFQVSKLADGQRSVVREFDKNDDRTNEELQIASKNLLYEANQLSQQLREYSQIIIENIDRKYKAVKTESIIAVNKQFESQCNIHYREIEQKIAHLKQKIEQEQRIRDETTQFMITSFGQEIIKLQQTLRKERDQRIRKGNQLAQIVQQMQDKAIQIVQNEKNQMLNSRSSLQGILQEVCFKIEAKILGK